MILKADDAYYILALSKRDFKPFLKIKNVLLGFAGCCSLQKLPPEAQLNHETYVLVHHLYSRSRLGPRVLVVRRSFAAIPEGVSMGSADLFCR